MQTHCLSPSCGPAPSHSPLSASGLDRRHRYTASGERTQYVSGLPAWSRPVPTETQPREWRSTLIGLTGGGGVCSCVVVVVVAATRLPAHLWTGASAEKETRWCEDEQDIKLEVDIKQQDSRPFIEKTTHETEQKRPVEQKLIICNHFTL